MGGRSRCLAEAVARCACVDFGVELLGCIVLLVTKAQYTLQIKINIIVVGLVQKY